MGCSLLFLTLFLKEQGEAKKSTDVQREASLSQNYQAEERKSRVASELPLALLAMLIVLQMPLACAEMAGKCCHECNITGSCKE
jgi:hypothetical protein